MSFLAASGQYFSGSIYTYLCVHVCVCAYVYMYVFVSVCLAMQLHTSLRHTHIAPAMAYPTPE